MNRMSFHYIYFTRLPREHSLYQRRYAFLLFQCSFPVLLPRLPVVSLLSPFVLPIFTFSNMYINTYDVE